MFQPEIATTWLTPGSRERGREVAVDAVAKPDQDPGREPGLGLGERQGERIARAAPEALDLAHWVGAAGTISRVRDRRLPAIPLGGGRGRSHRPAAAGPRRCTTIRSPGWIGG